MRRECWEHFHRHRLQRNPLVSDPGMHHGTCVTHVPWCMSGSLTRGARENVPGILGACATRNFTSLARGPWTVYVLVMTSQSMGATMWTVMCNTLSILFTAIFTSGRVRNYNNHLDLAVSLHLTYLLPIPIRLLLGPGNAEFYQQCFVCSKLNHPLHHPRKISQTWQISEKTF